MGLVLTQELPAGRADSLSGWNNSTNTIAGTVSQGREDALGHPADVRSICLTPPNVAPDRPGRCP